MQKKFLTVIILSLVAQSTYAFNPHNIIGRILPVPHRSLLPPMVRPLPPMPPRPIPPPVRPIPIPSIEPIVQMELPTTAGNGCPAGTVVAVLSPDKQTLSVIFDQFIAEAGPSSRKTFDLKNCILKIPLRTLNGNFAAKIESVEYRGATVLPVNSSLQIILQDAIFGGGRATGLIMNRERFVGPIDQDFLLTVDSPVHQVSFRPNPHTWSVCDRTQELNLSARMELVNNNPAEDAIASMDSVDVSTRISVDYKISWRACAR